ncbi:hypothetical protein AJ80_01455 [Polytolypa hystricis UAMH7299]|uniref:Xylanolytic transcriptional activator regulatory domain-containing protein n=1 Tax=Polytolypa hystricis (strain UAMH7299) TaxID=1447883 RepID=A0A2B7Z0X0_POLH7|nr:hypothetical protein AJ80_01455 [Polytolypa hystricis UAMH7299]
MARAQNVDHQGATLLSPGSLVRNDHQIGEAAACSTPQPWTSADAAFSLSGASPTKSPDTHVVEDATRARTYFRSNAEPALLLGCKYWPIYRNAVYPFYLVLVNIEQFEIDLCTFLETFLSWKEDLNRSDIDISWLSLLFAVLACGTQFPNDSSKERDLRFKFILHFIVYERRTSFTQHIQIKFSRSCSLEAAFATIQTRMPLGYSSTGKIELGTTARLAQSIGLHERSNSVDTVSNTKVLNEHEKNKLWWMVVWQDTHLSFFYDRPQSSIVMNRNIPYGPNMSQNRSFVDSILTLCWIIRDRAQKSATTLTYKKSLEDISQDACLFLTDKASCKALQNHLERLVLNIHVGYVICRICRLCIERTSTPSPILLDLRSDCHNRALRVVQSFLDLRRLFVNVCHSWGFVQNAVSYATILGMPASDYQSQQVESRPLIERLGAILKRDEQ